MHISRCLIISLALASALLASGCFGAKSDGEGPAAAAAAPSGDCKEVYTYAPALYTINIVAGDAVVLDPASQNFPLFCDPAKAKEAVNKEVAAGRLPGGVEWRVYQVWGDWNDIAVKGPGGEYLLGRSAPLVNWVN